MSGRGMSQKNLDLIEHCRNILAEIHPTTYAAWPINFSPAA